MLLDAHTAYEDNALTADGLIVDRPTFEAIAGMTDKQDRPILQITGNVGANTIGSVSASGQYANLDGLKIIMSPKLTAVSSALGEGVVGAFYNAQAIRTYASPLVSLQDSSILDLTGAFSVYYYAAFATEIPYALVPFKVDSL